MKNLFIVLGLLLMLMACSPKTPFETWLREKTETGWKVIHYDELCKTQLV